MRAIERLCAHCQKPFQAKIKELNRGDAKYCGRECASIVGGILRKLSIPHLKFSNEEYGVGTRLYRIWQAMKTRCQNPQATGYKYWGGRGIQVCEAWQDYAKFFEWAVSNGYAENLTIDRTDCDGNYEPSNCRWITIQAQMRNKRGGLTEASVSEIKAMLKSGDSHRVIAEKYMVDVGRIGAISSGRNWSDVL